MYARYNYFSINPVTHVLADIVKLLCGCTDKTQLNGKFFIGNQTVAYSVAGLNVVTWAGANTDITCSVGQSVSGTGIPVGAQILSITNQTSFSLGFVVTSITGGPGTLTFNKVGHGLLNGTAVQVSAVTSLPAAGGGNTGLSASTTYYIVNRTADTYQLAATLGGTALTANDNGVGAQSCLILATATGTICILGLTATLPPTSIGKGQAVTLASSTTVTHTGSNIDFITAGQKVSGYGIPANTTVVTPSTNSFTISNAATITGATTLVIEPGTPVCDATNTYIIAPGTTPAGYTSAGWTVWDSCAKLVSGNGYTSMIVLRQPVNDDPTKYIYLMLDPYSNTGYLMMTLYETWDNSAHTGTNASAIGGGSQVTQQLLSSPGLILISSSSGHVAMQSTINTGAIGTTYANDWTGVFQRTRKSPWDTVANGYPPAVSVSGVGIMNGNTYPPVAPRFKNPLGGDYTSTAVYGQFLGGGGNSNPNTYSVLTSKVPDGLGGFYVPLTELILQRADYSFLGGSISALSDVWLSVAYPKNQDECSANGKTYVLWQNSNTPATHSNCAFPKG